MMSSFITFSCESRSLMNCLACFFRLCKDHLQVLWNSLCSNQDIRFAIPLLSLSGSYDYFAVKCTCFLCSWPIRTCIPPVRPTRQQVWSSRSDFVQQAVQNQQEFVWNGSRMLWNAIKMSLIVVLGRPYSMGAYSHGEHMD